MLNSIQFIRGELDEVNERSFDSILIQIIKNGKQGNKKIVQNALNFSYFLLFKYNYILFENKKKSFLNYQR